MRISRALIKNTISEMAAYRLNFVFWRLRMMTRFLIAYFLWVSILSKQSMVAGYTLTTMITYLVTSYVLTAAVLSTRTQDVGDEINSGGLANALLRPHSYLSCLISKDIADKVVNVICALFEVAIFFFFLRISMFIQTDLHRLGLTLCATVGAIMLYFLISFLISMVGFWTNETWAIRFSFFILLEFFMGWLIPPDAFPAAIGRILFLTPFPYFSFFPTKLYLGALNEGKVIQGFIVLGVWILILGILCRFAWKRGLRVYSAEGR